MRILLINPNTTASITEAVAARARTVAPKDTEFLPVTGRFGAHYISDRTSAAIAAHAALDAYAEHGAGCDAVFLACFGDPGLFALRELSRVPVIGMAEASCFLACMLGRRFTIITAGAKWRAMLEELVSLLGLTDRLASIRTVAFTGEEILHDRNALLPVLRAECTAAVQTDMADVVILGGAALAGLAERVSDDVLAPVLCSVEAGALAAIAAGRLRLSSSAVGRFRPAPPVQTIGLGVSLATAMTGYCSEP